MMVLSCMHHVHAHCEIWQKLNNLKSIGYIVLLFSKSFYMYMTTDEELMKTNMTK